MLAGRAEVKRVAGFKIMDLIVHGKFKGAFQDNTHLFAFMPVGSLAAGTGFDDFINRLHLFVANVGGQQFAVNLSVGEFELYPILLAGHHVFLSRFVCLEQGNQVDIKGIGNAFECGDGWAGKASFDLGYEDIGAFGFFGNLLEGEIFLFAVMPNLFS